MKISPVLNEVYHSCSYKPLHLKYRYLDEIKLTFLLEQKYRSVFAFERTKVSNVKILSDCLLFFLFVFYAPFIDYFLLESIFY